MDVQIVDLAKAHVGPVVELHMNSFPDFFLTFLGRSFLKQMYLSYANDGATIALVALGTDRRGVLGAVVGPLQPGRFFKRILIARWWRFGLAATGALLRRPSIMPRMLRAVRYRGDQPHDGGERALLASIAVSPEAQGLGVGKLLTRAFLRRVREAGLPGSYLTTDADNNDAVNAFYHRLGWKLESDFETPEGRRINRYVYDFGDHPG